MILMITYKEGLNERGEWTARCDVLAGTFWPDTYTISTIILFFLLPFFILLIIYGMIAKGLTMDRSNLNAKNENYKGRKQVVTMLGNFFVVWLNVIMSSWKELSFKNTNICSWYNIAFLHKKVFI